ncbi:MAG: 7-carboxy-7-deazaguanine synthase [Betaproteobacteria bacterium]|nr:MAG: 7-carboxy-7-deazaguanine synthase [Betaproteobacteria bacterium]
MSYSVKEIFYTLQGEGANVGTPAVFCRFAGCNLWSGREEDRSNAICKFCDTDFVGTDGIGGAKFRSADDLGEAILKEWPCQDAKHRFVVLTGGEPGLQLDAPLLEALHARRFRVAIETNGTVSLPHGIDWICVSPKSTAKLTVCAGNELKLVYPQADAMPEFFEAMSFEYFFLQPMDRPDRQQSTARAIEYCRAHPKWRLSIQTHKMIGIP